ncbi:glycine hydroxymethyltransferase [Amycolatopsis arida]|uniref:Glycine hydroxymethyltransferase n=1 Tax=Amycolatopsis arida TaxID=587909 RepID=A0A1I5MJR2_9PSEU|nr:serine hydroxymethyltransferase [Amycolatopsis arida]TDX94120.1 glycine hydroxymethyltransferase [Amycolatopsis arida]SFP09822.1 glycine hydroxymethyltransferase [Amycolatopsis arida]
MSAPFRSGPVTAPIPDPGPAALAERAVRALAAADSRLYQLLADDLRAQAGTLSLVASAGAGPVSALAGAGALGTVAAHGYPGRRLRAGCAEADEVERLAVHRAMAAFSARHANVQPHSGTAARSSVCFGLLEPGDTILVPDPAGGGQHALGSPVSVSGRYFTAVSYGFDTVGRVDDDRLLRLARRFRPKIVVCAAGDHPRTPDFARFRAVADEVGAYLLADISEVAGLVAAGLHPNPVDDAHITTASTAQLGARGGVILLGKDADTPVPGAHHTLRRLVQRSVFPLTQGAADAAAVAAKARVFAHVTTEGFGRQARRAVAGARRMAAVLLDHGHDVLTYGTDNHLVVTNVMSRGTTGVVAEAALESCGLLTARARVPFDVKPPQVGSGLRVGSNVLAARGMSADDMAGCAELLDTVLGAVTPRSDTEYSLPDAVRLRVRDAVTRLCHRFPLPDYPVREDPSDGRAATAC